MSNIVAKGIDISEHNTRRGRIDFNTARASGKCDFAIIRVGWAGYNGTIDYDENLDRTIQDAQAAGVDVGLYVYTYTKTPAAARQAAQNVVTFAKGRGLTYPIVFDVEETADPCLTAQSKAGLTDTVLAFLQEVERLGYYAMWYTYSSFVLESRLDYERLKSYDFWMADYRATPWNAPCGMWQYIGDKGTCPGVNGACDGNYAYKNYPFIIKSAGLNGFEKPDTPEVKPEPPTNDIDILKSQLKFVTAERDKYKAVLDSMRKLLE